MADFERTGEVASLLTPARFPRGTAEGVADEYDDAGPMDNAMGRDTADAGDADCAIAGVVARDGDVNGERLEELVAEPAADVGDFAADSGSGRPAARAKRRRPRWRARRARRERVARHDTASPDERMVASTEMTKSCDATAGGRVGGRAVGVDVGVGVVADEFNDAADDEDADNADRGGMDVEDGEGC
jgi:hypothetical protein